MTRPAASLRGDGHGLGLKRGLDLIDEAAAEPRCVALCERGQAPPPSGTQRRRGRVAGEYRPRHRMVKAGAANPLQRWAGGEQHVPQPVRGAIHVVGEVVVIAGQHTQLLERLV